MLPSVSCLHLTQNTNCLPTQAHQTTAHLDAILVVKPFTSTPPHCLHLWFSKYGHYRDRSIQAFFLKEWEVRKEVNINFVQKEGTVQMSAGLYLCWPSHFESFGDSSAYLDIVLL